MSSQRQLPPFDSLPKDERERFELRARYLIENGWIQTDDSIDKLARQIYAKVGRLEPYEKYDPFKDLPKD